MNFLDIVFFTWGFLISMGIFIKDRRAGNFTLAISIGGPLLYGVLYVADSAVDAIFDYFQFTQAIRVMIFALLSIICIVSFVVIRGAVWLYRKNQKSKPQADQDF